MFVGQHQRSLDDKGRIALPSQFRDDLGATCLVSHLSDVPALAMWSRAEYDEVVGRLRARVEDGRSTQKTLRRFAAATHELRIDGQGRVTLPQELRDRFNIEREAVVNGAFTRIEIWAPTTWEAENAADDDNDFDDATWL